MITTQNFYDKNLSF
uniref:Uncharacterized protein n=1 Tax=Rhizophora mucronata TaxID=61149 RepID=A0A2P2P633_RHIMU